MLARLKGEPGDYIKVEEAKIKVVWSAAKIETWLLGQFRRQNYMLSFWRDKLILIILKGNTRTECEIKSNFLGSISLLEVYSFFAMNPHISQFVGWSVGLPIIISLKFNPPIGACFYQSQLFFKIDFLRQPPSRLPRRLLRCDPLPRRV